MGVVGYSDHVRISLLARGNSRGWERGKAVAVAAKRLAWPGTSSTW
jgi:hypothetical protein